MRSPKEHILYVDDEDALIYIAKRTLNRAGYSVTACTDPAKALQLFQAKPDEFALVVTDMSMPHMSGLDLARSLHGIRPDLPIIMTSGYMRKQDQDEANKLGIRDLILKPASANDLCSALDRALKH